VSLRLKRAVSVKRPSVGDSADTEGARTTTVDAPRQNRSGRSKTAPAARHPAPSPQIEPDVAEGMAPPPGAPRWITAELMFETWQTWQPYYNEPLTADDVLGMIVGVGQLMELLGEPSP